MRKRKSIDTIRVYKWLALVTAGGCTLQFAGCLDDILFAVAPFLL
jgi:hypothetical protein